ncbi:MAG: CPBP family intramembrane glutamic endopeptidase [Candidatus Eiseniibacteriota bacterium]
MHDANQGAGEEGTPPVPLPGVPEPPPLAPSGAGPSGIAAEIDRGADPTDLAPPVAAGTDTAETPAPDGPPIARGLRIWLVLIGVAGLAGLVFEQAELALMATLAGAFAAAHAADRDPRYLPLHLLLTGVYVAGGAAFFAGLALWLATQSESGPLRPIAAGIAGGAAVLSVLTALRPLSDGMASAVFRTLRQTHTLRLGARIVLMLLLFVIPGAAAVPSLLDFLEESSRPLLDAGQLLASLAGLTLLALGGVGFLVRRDLRASIERLGLRAPRPAHYAVVLAGVVTLYLLNVGVETVQRTWFPALWEHDQRINQMMAGGLGPGGGLLLGVSAGVGEELAIRGALQPRLGLVFTAVVFAALHVHYSWVGMATILLLGVVLGVIRERTNTTVAILVHTIYDILAVMTTGGPEGG